MKHEQELKPHEDKIRIKRFNLDKEFIEFTESMRKKRRKELCNLITNF